MHHAIHLPYTLIKEQRTNEKYCDLLCRSFIFNFFFFDLPSLQVVFTQKERYIFRFCRLFSGITAFFLNLTHSVSSQECRSIVVPRFAATKTGHREKKNVVEEDRSSKRDRAKEKKNAQEASLSLPRRCPVSIYMSRCAVLYSVFQGT